MRKEIRNLRRKVVYGMMLALLFALGEWLYVTLKPETTSTFTLSDARALADFPQPFILNGVLDVTMAVGGTHEHGPKNWQAWTVDVLGGIGVAGRLGQDLDSGLMYQFVDTDVATYNDDTVKVDWSAIPTHVISIGSSFVNMLTYEYETHGGVPFYMTEVGGQPVIHSDSTGSDYGSVSDPPAYDHAVIALVFDSSVERYVMLVYGVTGKGSQAACMVLQNYDFYNGILRGRAVIIKWEDTNLNGLVDADDTVSQIEVWS